MPTMQQSLTRCWFALLIVAVFGAIAQADESPETIEFFERSVRPVLVEHCQKCHGPEKQESDLRLDSREALLKGGASGPAITSGKPEKSLLVAAIRQEGDIQMPPNSKLTDEQIAAVERWIQLGAPWPNDGKPVAKTNQRGLNHWAFQPVSDPSVPTVAGNTSPNPIDAFIAAKLTAAGFTFSPPADRRTLIRRATYDLTGLPPTPDEVEAFERDQDPRAYERLIDRLLASPHYGEQWGRHWLDIARYSDTKGYVYAREQRFWVHAWVYRDWVVKALNDDMPYNRFLLLQIAADQAAPEDKSSLAAMGFLTLGRRFLGVARDIIDDRIDVVTRGTMGLTVGCARCHDHKYDPIPTRDYYSLYGVFQSSSEQLVPLEEPTTRNEAYQAFEKEWHNRLKKLADTMATRRAETSARVRSRAGDYLAAQFDLDNYPEEGFDQILAKSDLLPNFVRRWQANLAHAHKTNDPVFVAWHQFTAIPSAEFANAAKEVVSALQSLPDGKLNPRVKQKFTTAPASHAEVASRYGELFAEVEREWQTALKDATEQKRPAPTSLNDAAAEALRQVLYSPTGPCEVPDEPIVNTEYFFDSDTCNELWRLQNEVDNWILQSSLAPMHAAILVDRDPPTTPRVFKRGNPATKGEEVPRHFVSVIAGPQPPPFQHGSGRLELAQAIIDPKNPLTPRVMVNRVWANHFGAGLVRTPSDFGTRAEPPSHPELLDWLTSRFMEEGWSLKKLHRRILLSQAYQQRSAGPSDANLVAKYQQVDPENRLLWRMNDRRLSFEEMYDSLQAASGSLERTLGGKATDLLGPAFKRRSLYGLIDRQFFPSTLRIFDFANPDLHIPQRSSTTVPQQALFFLNHPLLLRQAQALAARTATASSDAERVQQMYRYAYQRAATPEQLQLALELVRQAREDKGSVIPPTVAAWQYGFGAYDEATKRVASFERLPHFTGDAWQGGSNYPDAKFGWVQLSAVGGHPGNDLQHAAIRRWIAPRDMRVKVQSELIHEPQEGKGVRGFVVSSRAGLLKSAQVHHGKAELSADTLEVKAGDTLDFVADIGSTLNSNQFLWKATISSEDGQTIWDSQVDFQNQGVKRLEPWEQLAQVLLSANEFVFVD
jgi:mono/diheme cytochrome c family protein